MLAVEYIEIDSTYRDREEYPLPSFFVVRSSESGRASPTQARDPVCKSSPLLTFTPFPSYTGTLTPVVPNTPGGSGDMTTVLIISFSSVSNLSKQDDYYAGLVLDFGTSYGRIKYWKYLNTIGGNDEFQITLISATGPKTPGAVALINPTNLQDPANLLIYIPNSVGQNNFYINYVIFNQTREEWLDISYYDGTSRLAQLSSVASTHYTPGSWQLGDVYILRTEAPFYYGDTLVGISPTQATLSQLTQPGNFLQLQTAPYLSRRIINVNPTTNIVTVSPGFPSTPAGTYEILPFSYDNEGFLPFTSTRKDQAVCYEVQLLNITLPNFVLDSAHGSRAIYYPYVYVELTPLTGSQSPGPNVITSNNPNATGKLFRTLINDSTNLDISPIIRLDGNGMVQTIKVNATRASFQFGVYLPDGSLFNTIVGEDYSPSPPNPLIQISAVFSFKRVATSTLPS